jgi:hypothetical protein
LRATECWNAVDVSCRSNDVAARRIVCAGITTAHSVSATQEHCRRRARVTHLQQRVDEHDEKRGEHDENVPHKVLECKAHAHVALLFDELAGALVHAVSVHKVFQLLQRQRPCTYQHDK